MFTERSFVDSIEVLGSNVLQVRRVDVVIRDGVEEVARTNFRYVVVPGDDLTGQDPRVVAIARAAWATEAPVPPGVTGLPPLRLVSRRQFARLFTADERIGIRAAASANPRLADFYDLLQFDDTVNLDHPDVAAGLAALAAARLLAPDRADTIIAGIPPTNQPAPETLPE